MIEINFNNVVKNYGFKNVLNGFSFETKTGERIALIGPNGCGKTTIFHIIAGKENINDGLITIRKGSTIGLLNQTSIEEDNSCTVRQVLQKGIEDLIEMENKLHQIEEEMAVANSNKLKTIIGRYSELQEKFIQMGGYEIEEKMNKICNGFKISKNLLSRDYHSLSGGEKTIVNLAKIILNNPSILLLDEPTNHLDVDTLEWFENFLSNYNGTVIISSHDRYFLDKVATKTILIDQGKAEIFNGNYSYFLKENERIIMTEFESYKNQQKKISAMKEAIKKLKEWAVIGNNEKFAKRATCIERRLEKLELLEKPETKKQLPLDFDINERSGKDVLSVDELNIVLGDKVIFEGVSFKLKYGEKTCLIGKNGTGKTTLVKAIINGYYVISGEIKIGSNVCIGYIPQEIKFDDEKATVLESARKWFDGFEMHLRSSLAKFLFYGDSVYKKVGSLSGGERVRLKLFELIQKKANFLVLDEPTNHIDIDTREMLEEALIDYRGTLLFISHDRYFINKVATRILNIEKHKIKQYLGNYDYYKEHRYK